MTTLSYIATFRLAIWRELHARGGLLLLFMGLVVVGAVLPSDSREAWEAFALFLVLPPLAIALALRGPARADSFWRGLGGPGTARALGTAFVHLGVLLGTAVLLDLIGPINWTGFFPSSYSTDGYLYVYFLASLWALIFAGRAVAQGLVAVVPLLVAGAGIWGITLLSDLVARWPVESAVTLRIALVGAAALLCGVFLEGPVGAWGGAIWRRGLSVASVSVALALVLLGSLAVEATTQPHWGIVNAEWGQVAPDGSVAFRYSRDDLSEAWTPWLQRWTPEAGLAWWRRGGDNEAFEVGPKGALLIGDEVTWPDGTTTSCEGAGYVMNWSPDGSAVTLLPRVEDQALEGDRWDRSLRWFLARPEGCTRMPRSVSWLVARDHGEVLYIEDQQLHLGPSYGASRLVPFPDGRQAEGIWVRPGASMTLVGRRLGDEHSLWMLRGESLALLAENSKARTPDPRFHFRIQQVLGDYQIADGCASTERSLSCWNPSGERIVGPLSEPEQEGLFFLGRGWVWARDEGLIFRPRDGARVLLPDSGTDTGSKGQNLELVVFLPTGGARHFGRGGLVRDIDLPD